MQGFYVVAPNKVGYEWVDNKHWDAKRYVKSKHQPFYFYTLYEEVAAPTPKVPRRQRSPIEEKPIVHREPPSTPHVSVQITPPSKPSINETSLKELCKELAKGKSLAELKNLIEGTYTLTGEQQRKLYGWWAAEQPVEKEGKQKGSLKTPATLTLTDPTQYLGNRYVHVGTHGGKDVYARIDRVALSTTFSTKEIGVYDTSMRKGVIPSGSSGKDGIKHESHLGCWVIKITIAIATANEMDNSLSLAAAAAETADGIYLNFDRTIRRH